MSGGVNHGAIPTASVRLKVGKRSRTESCTGNGPVDAVYNCISRLTGIRCKLTSYKINANGSGMDALGEVNVNVDYNGRIFHGMGISTDVIEASALALINACNIIERARLIDREKVKERKEKNH